MTTHHSDLVRITLPPPDLIKHTSPGLESEHFVYHPRNSQLLELFDYDKLCKVNSTNYVICPEYCCGEFWESKPQFCCSNNFDLLRNLFYFLLASCAGLLTTIVIYMIVERIVKRINLTRLEKLKEKYNLSILSGNNKDHISSEDTSLEEDSSSVEAHRKSPSKSKPKKQLLKMHSQNFKDMLKLQSSKRVKNTYKSTVTKMVGGSKSAKSVIDYVGSDRSRAGPGSATSPETPI